MNQPTFRSLDLNLLRVFDAVMSERSLTRAAQRLSLTQPAVSNAVRRLREALGDDLVRRSGAGVEPTARALALWPAVSQALRQLEMAITPGDFSAAQATDSFVLAMADATAAELLPGLIDFLERDAPGVSIRVVPLTTRDPRRLLDDGAADLAIGHFPAALADLTAQAQSGLVPAFAHERLYDGEYVCVMRQGHPLARGPLSLGRYCGARHLLVSFSGRPFGFVDEALAAVGQRRRIVMTVNQFFTAGRIVARSDLLTVLPRHFIGVTGMAGELVLRPLPLDVPAVHVESLWHRRRERESAHAWLRLAIRAAALRAFGDMTAPPLPSGAAGTEIRRSD